MSPIFGIRSGPIEEIAQQENDESPVVICSELRRRFNGAECMATFHANKGHDLDGMAISLLLIAECKVVEAGEPKPARSPLLEIPVFEDRTGKIHLRTREGYALDTRKPFFAELCSPS